MRTINHPLKTGDIITALYVNDFGSTCRDSYSVHQADGGLYLRQIRPNVLGDYPISSIDVIKDALIYHKDAFHYRIDAELDSSNDNWRINIVEDAPVEEIMAFMKEQNLNPRFTQWEDVYLCSIDPEELLPVYRRLYPPNPSEKLTVDEAPVFIDALKVA